MTPKQAHYLEMLQCSTQTSDGALMQMARQIGSGCPCKINTLMDLSSEEIDQLINQLVEIEADLIAKRTLDAVMEIVIT